MTIGDIVKDDFVVVDGLTKTNTAVTKGTIVVFNTDGWTPAGAATIGPHGICLTTQAAVAGTQTAIQVLIKGCAKVAKPSGAALNQGVAIESDTNAKAVVYKTAGTVLDSVVGVVTKKAETTDTEVEVEMFF